MIKKSLLLTTAVMLTGCSQIPLMYDRADPCQIRPELNRPVGYQIPNWCGAAAGGQRIVNSRGATIGFIR